MENRYIEAREQIVPDEARLHMTISQLGNILFPFEAIANLRWEQIVPCIALDRFLVLVIYDPGNKLFPASR
jgi:hypothetical protein